MEHIPIWAIILVWVIFLLMFWMVADVVQAVVAYLRALKIKTMYEVTALHNAAVEYSEKVMKERGPEVDGCKFHGTPNGPPIGPV